MNRIIGIVFGLMVFSISPTFAVEDNIEALMDETDEVVIEYSEREIESNFVSKAYTVEGDDKNNYLVEGGNEDAINTLATKQHTAQGTLIESTNVQGQSYDLQVLSHEEKIGKNMLELRQFLSFETKSGKVFHLIIDHSKSVNNVQMLTEVGEQDLLNLIEAYADVALVLEQEDSEIVEKPMLSQNTAASSDETIIQVADSEETQDNKSSIIIIGASILVGVAGWYYKIYKPKQRQKYDEEVDEADYIDDVYEEDDDIDPQ